MQYAGYATPIFQNSMSKIHQIPAFEQTVMKLADTKQKTTNIIARFLSNIILIDNIYDATYSGGNLYLITLNCETFFCRIIINLEDKELEINEFEDALDIAKTAKIIFDDKKNKKSLSYLDKHLIIQNKIPVTIHHNKPYVSLYNTIDEDGNYTLIQSIDNMNPMRKAVSYIL